MSYTELTSTVVSNADTLMANFYHVALGDLLPLSGASFLPANMTGYVGSATAIWKTLYCNAFAANDSITSNGKFKVLLASTDSTAGVASVTYNLTTGATTARHYEMFVQGTDNSTLGLQFVLNGLSGTNYSWMISTITAQSTGAPLYYDKQSDDVTLKCFPDSAWGRSTTVFHIVFSALNMPQKMVHFEGLAITGNSITAQCTGSGYCKDETTSLESIKLIWTATNLRVELWGYK
jgi:hypothetical protein